MALVDTLLTVPEAARSLGCSEETVKRLARDGTLRATRVGRRLCFAADDVEAYRLAHPQAVPERRRASAASYLTRLHLVTGVFTHLHTPEQAAALAVSQCIRTLGAQSGVLSLVEDGEALALMYTEGYSEEGMRPWVRIPLSADLPASEVVRSGEPRFYESPAALIDRFPGLAGRTLESAAWAILPLPVDGRVIGAIVLGFVDPYRFSSDERTFLFAVAQQCAQAIERARLYAAARAAQERALLLAEIGQSLARAQLDLGAVLDETVRRISAGLGDACSVLLLDEAGAHLTQAAYFHSDPAAMALLTQIVAEPIPIGMGFSGRVAATGEPVFIPVAEPAQIHEQAHPAYREYATRFPVRSLMLAPLRAGASLIGVLGTSRYTPGRPYTADDLQLLRDLADRAAVAIENAQLYAAEQRARAAAERAAERTAVLQTITAALSSPYEPGEIAELVMAEGMRAVGATGGALSLRNDDGSFTLVRMVGYPVEVVARWLGRSYPGTLAAPIPDAVAAQAPIWLETPAALHERYPHLAEQLAGPHLGAWATVPLVADGQAFGGFTFLFPSPRRFADEDKGFMLALSRQCAQAIVRSRLHEAGRRAEAEAEVARRRLVVLAEAGARLAGSLDIATTIDTVAGLVVPDLADWCVIDLLAADGTVETAAVAHRDPALRELALEMVRRHPIDPAAPGGTAAVLRTLRTELVPVVTDEMLVALAQSEDHLASLRRTGLRSTLCAPLVARGRALGTIALVATQPGRYSQADLPFVEELASRAALAIDNARLYAAEHEAVRLRDTFFSVAAHELKTPLTSLLGQAQLVLRRGERAGSLAERDRQAIQVVVNQAARLNRMILAMLDSTRLEQGRLSIERAPLDLAALAEQVADELRPSLERHELTVVAENNPYMLLGDALRLEQVLQNLIGNALKYSPDGGPVEVRLSRDGDHVVLAVSDRGIGIPATAIPQLFQRFFRVSEGVAGYISGMGIGLYVVKEIVALHGGEVAVESRLGAGSTFTVRLPGG